MPTAEAANVQVPLDSLEESVDRSDRWRLTLPGGRILDLGQWPKVMGIVNLTPDSFSDGGRWRDSGAAIDGALAMIEAGADILDLGAESTRPGGGVYGQGAREVDVEEECRRLLPVLEGLRAATDRPLSVDTRHAQVAQRALDCGADLINDVSALSDPDMAQQAAEAGCPIVLMHSRGEISTMQRDIRFVDVVHEVARELAVSLDKAEAAGIDRRQIILDPGLGFGKTYEQNIELMARPQALTDLGRPVLLGASRKSFIGHLTGGAPGERLAGSLATAAWAAESGAALLRVHDVRETVDLLKVWHALATARAATGETSESGADR